MKDNKQNTLLLTVIAIATLLVAVVGATFAYFTATGGGQESTSTIQISGATLTIDYSDGSASLGVPQNVTGIEPQANALVTKTFTISGKNTAAGLTMPYEIGLMIVNNTFSNNALSYKLTNVAPTSGTITLVTNGEGTLPGSAVATRQNTATSASKSSTAVTNTYVKMADGTFAAKTTTAVDHVYQLEVFFLDDGTNQDHDKLAQFAAYVEISAKEATIN